MRRGVALATAILLTLAIVPLTSAEARGDTKTIDVYANLTFTVKCEGQDVYVTYDHGETSASTNELTLPPGGAWVCIRYHITVTANVVNASGELKASLYSDIWITSRPSRFDREDYKYEESINGIHLKNGTNTIYKHEDTVRLKATPGLLWYYLYYIMKGRPPRGKITCTFTALFMLWKGKLKSDDGGTACEIYINISSVSATPLLTSLVKSRHTPAKMPFSSMLEKSKQILPVGSLIKSILNSIEEKLAERSEKTSTSERRNPAPAPTNWI